MSIKKITPLALLVLIFCNGYSSSDLEKVPLDSEIPNQPHIDLAHFHAQLIKEDKNEAHISWSSLDDSSVDQYVVEKSTNGSTFKELAYIQRKDITYQDLVVYTYVDDYLINETDSNVYYRISALDKQGNPRYSEIKAVPSISFKRNAFNVSASLQNKRIEVELQGEIYESELAILDQKNTELQYFTFVDQNHISIPVNNLENGTYTMVWRNQIQEIRQEIQIK